MDYKSQEALSRAKDNVEKYYPVVGLFESMDDSMLLLERTYPTVFDGFHKFFLENEGSYFKSTTTTQF